MALAIFANKQFHFAIWPLLLRWMSEKAFRDWWHFKFTFYVINGSHICPDYHIVIQDGKPYLKAFWRLQVKLPGLHDLHVDFARSCH